MPDKDRIKNESMIHTEHPSTGFSRSTVLWQKLDSTIERFFLLCAIVTFAALVILAWHHRFIQDDAFISFRYARNLLNGNGLVWNPGERVEGYTNFLWTILISSGMAAGIDPVLGSQLLGMICFIASLVITYRTAFLLFCSRPLSLLTILLLGTNYTFSSYATGGLETQLQTMLCLLGVLLTLRFCSAERTSFPGCITVSLVLAAALLTRLDSAIFCIVILASVALHLRKGNRPLREKIEQSIAMTAPLVIIIGGWFVWKIFYYGNIFPNTFYVKASSITSVERGLNFLYVFLISYSLWPFILLGLFFGNRFLKESRVRFGILLSILFLWIAYIIKVGGDFMEFRFLVPVLPLLFVSVVWLLFTVIPYPSIRFVGIAVILWGTIHHAQTFSFNTEDRIEPTDDLRGHLYDEDKNWTGIGKTLGERFHFDTTITIATTAAGAIPYYSRMHAVDMLGLNDPWIAHNGVVVSTIPGHQRLAPLSYLVSQKVNLIISHPQVLPINASVNQVPLIPGMTDINISDFRLIEIPLDDNYKFVVLYLTSHPNIDSAIKRYGWTTEHIFRSQNVQQ